MNEWSDVTWWWTYRRNECDMMVNELTREMSVTWWWTYVRNEWWLGHCYCCCLEAGCCVRWRLASTPSQTPHVHSRSWHSSTAAPSHAAAHSSQVSGTRSRSTGCCHSSTAAETEASNTHNSQSTSHSAASNKHNRSKSVNLSRTFYPPLSHLVFLVSEEIRKLHGLFTDQMIFMPCPQNTERTQSNESN